VTAAPGAPLASLRFVSAPSEISTGLRVLPPVGQRIVPIFEHIASAAGKPLRPGARVLDFGAGAGRHVAEFREAGYDALGVDHQYLSHAEGSVEHEFLRRVEPPDYVLPFADGEFDLVYSTSVMEHVLDPGVALTQIARVLRPGGISIHHFPSRWRPVEPHMLVPFGGRFQSFHLMRLWARLGGPQRLPEGPARHARRTREHAAREDRDQLPDRDRVGAPRRAAVRVGGVAEGAFVEATRPVSRVSLPHRSRRRSPGRRAGLPRVAHAGPGAAQGSVARGVRRGGRTRTRCSRAPAG
jgi:SAM-dependent methyltransferase